MNEQATKSQLQHVIAFALMFVACLVGSVIIFTFAVGLETGNKIVVAVMTSLIEHAFIIFGVFIVFNMLLLGFYWKNKKGNKV